MGEVLCESSIGRLMDLKGILVAASGCWAGSILDDLKCIGCTRN